MLKPETNSVIEAKFSKVMDESKIMTEFKMPNFDMNALMDMQRKNLETLAVVNQTIFENLQSFAKRQAEVMSLGFEETTSLMNAILAAPTQQEKIVCQAQASKNVAEKYMTHARDAAETLAKCNNQAMEAVSHRMSDGLEELRGLIRTDIAA